jgi:hypothetical protein
LNIIQSKDFLFLSFFLFYLSGSAARLRGYFQLLLSGLSFILSTLFFFLVSGSDCDGKNAQKGWWFPRRKRPETKFLPLNFSAFLSHQALTDRARGLNFLRILPTGFCSLLWISWMMREPERNIKEVEPAGCIGGALWAHDIGVTYQGAPVRRCDGFGSGARQREKPSFLLHCLVSSPARILGSPFVLFYIFFFQQKSTPF